MQPLERSTYLAGEARQGDPDRYLCALFAPAPRRDAVMGLILFNRELARVPDVVSQPMAGMIRYQWWRDAIDEIAAGKAPRQHPVVEALAQALQRGWVEQAALQALIDAREPALERLGGGDAEALERFVAATSGALQTMLYVALGGRDAGQACAAAEIGTAFGLVGIVRAVAIEARRNPGDEAAGRVQPDAPAAVAGMIGTITARIEALMCSGHAAAGRPARDHITAFLPAALTRSYLRQLRRIGGPAPPTLARPARAPLTLAARALFRRP